MIQTTTNQDKIQQAKKQIRRSQKDIAGTFLTGTGLYDVEVEEEKPYEEDDLYFEETDPNEMLKYLVKK
jgi:predicted house-cleaning NTP pyrophosphatase (Maf/HAM1 superfamily)